MAPSPSPSDAVMPTTLTNSEYLATAIITMPRSGQITLNQYRDSPDDETYDVDYHSIVNQRARQSIYLPDHRALQLNQVNYAARGDFAVGEESPFYAADARPSRELLTLITSYIPVHTFHLAQPQLLCEYIVDGTVRTRALVELLHAMPIETSPAPQFGRKDLASRDIENWHRAAGLIIRFCGHLIPQTSTAFNSRTIGNKLRQLYLRLPARAGHQAILENNGPRLTVAHLTTVKDTTEHPDEVFHYGHVFELDDDNKYERRVTWYFEPDPKAMHTWRQGAAYDELSRSERDSIICFKSRDDMLLWNVAELNGTLRNLFAAQREWNVARRKQVAIEEAARSGDASQADTQAE